MNEELCRIEDMCLSPLGMGNGLQAFDMILKTGEVWKLRSDMQDDAHLLLKTLATLNVPISGKYIFMRSKLDFSDYRRLLQPKRHIGYLAPDASLIRNRTVRENLNIGRWYFLNTLSPKLDSETAELCRVMGINQIVDKLPTDLIVPDQRTVIAVRELAREPALLILERPVEFVGLSSVEHFNQIVTGMIKKGTTVVFMSDDQTLFHQHVTGEIRINNGQLSMKRYE